MNDPQTPPDLLAWVFSPDARAALSGAAGGIVRWITLQESLRAGLLSILVGSISAVYLGPLVAPLLDPVVGKLVPDGDSHGFAAFVVGLGGISLTGFLIDVIRARRFQLGKAANDDSESEERDPAPPAPGPVPRPPLQSLGDPEA